MSKLRKMFFFYEILQTTFSDPQFSDFQSQFSISKIIRSFLKKIIKEYYFQSTSIDIDIF